MGLLVAVLIIWIAGTVLWIAAIVSVSRVPAAVYEATGRSQGGTIALVVVTGWLGALYYWLVLKRQLVPA